METSILYCIKDPIPFIIIGGTSGIGKTSIIDLLLHRFPHFFEQPTSFTTRKKRSEDDRYVFINKKEIFDLYHAGKLINLDEVHNEYYGIGIKELERIKRANKIPIKEIHPKNFKKFQSNNYNTISIILENSHKEESDDREIYREGRPNEIFFSETCNFKLNISGLNIEEAATYVLKKIVATKLHDSLFESIENIDKINKIGYGEISEEFTDSKRVTTRNFHDASRGFWKSLFESIGSNSSEILELGYGNGWLLKNFYKTGNIYSGVDISHKMVSMQHDILITASARNIPVKANSYDYIIGSLVDPLISFETLVEIERVLRPEGTFAFTVPSHEWATNLPTRINKNETVFKKENGETVKVFSFCNTVEILPSALSFLNFKIELIRSFTLPLKYDKTISPAVKEAAKQCNKAYEDLPIITSVILKKHNGENI